MARPFFDQIDDELRGLVGPGLRDFRSLRTSALVKVWYGDPAVHYEVQRLSMRWAPDPTHRLEVGLHLEYPVAERNDRLLGLVLSDGSWRGALPAAGAGRAVSPRAADWRRVSEFVEGGFADDPDLAGEVAERLAVYIRTLEPLLRRVRAEPGA